MVNILDITRFLLSDNFTIFIFPFLIIYTLFFTILTNPKIKILQSSKTGKTNKMVVVFICLPFAFVGSIVQINGYYLGNFLMLLFPKMSLFSMCIIGLYLVGSFLGKDFFKDAFRKDISAYFYYSAGIIGLSSVLYYLFIIFGVLNLDPKDASSYLTFVLLLSFLVLAIILLSLKVIAWGLVSLVFAISLLFSLGQKEINNILLDPFLFIFGVFIILFSWLTKSSGEEKIKEVKKSLEAQNKYKESLEKDGVSKPPYEDRIYDITTELIEQNKKLLNKLEEKQKLNENKEEK